MTRSSVVVFSVLLMTLSTTPYFAQAQEANWIGLVSIIETSTRVSFLDRPLLAGGIYNFTFRINVPFDSTETLILSTPLQQAGTQYWYLQGSYRGIDLTQWTPSRPSITMRQIRGTAVLSLIGKTPEDLTIRRVTVDRNTLVLRFQNSNYIAASLNVVSSGAGVGSLTVTVIDQTIAAYNPVLQSKEALLKTQGAERTYLAFLNSVLQQAKQLYALGLVAEATNVLNQIPPSVPLEPKPPEPSPLPLLLGGVAGVLLAGLAGMALMFLRARGKLSLLKNVVLDQAGRLDVSLVRIQRTDKAIAAEIEQIKSRLKEVSS